MKGVILSSVLGAMVGFVLGLSLWVTLLAADFYFSQGIWPSVGQILERGIYLLMSSNSTPGGLVFLGLFSCGGAMVGCFARGFKLVVETIRTSTLSLQREFGDRSVHLQ